MKTIFLIGNLNKEKAPSCGQRTKTILYSELLKRESFPVIECDLEKYKKNPFGLLKCIKNGIKKCDIVVALPGPSSCHYIFRIVNLYNKKYNRRVVYSAIGTGFIFKYLENKSDSELSAFFDGGWKDLKVSKKDKKAIKGIDCLLFETPLLCEIHKELYQNNNCFVLDNFRDDSLFNKYHQYVSNGNDIKLIYLSRVVEEKGIFDLLTVFNIIKESVQKNIHLDIYGNSSALSEKQSDEFKKLANSDGISYRGIIPNKDVVNTISGYDLFCFPTRFSGEGIPGVLSESLIAGVPVISSDFFQAKYILKNNTDSIFFKMFDVKDLESKLISIINDEAMLKKITSGARDSGRRFLYSNQRDLFVGYVLGTGDK